ncbi:MAG: hypothetical protein WC238_03400 [Parcubacteria group bacterium]|jgi:hypothetical protein
MKKMIFVVCLFLALAGFIVHLPDMIILRCERDIGVMKKALVSSYQMYRQKNADGDITRFKIQWIELISAEGKVEECKEFSNFDQKLSCSNALVNTLNELIERQAGMNKESGVTDMIREPEKIRI